MLLQNDNGQKAMIGIGFPERNDSFDFIAGLDDFRKQLRIAKGQVSGSSGSSAASGKDFSLKEGEKISINIPGITSKHGSGEPKAPSLGGGGLKKLAPPASSKKPLAPP